MTKETEALNLLREVLVQSVAPIVLWSSGKDSMVVLHLTLRLRDVPVMWWRLPKFPEKQKHGNWVIQTWHLESYDMAPLFTEYVQYKDWCEVIHAYGPDPSTVVAMTTGIAKWEEGKPYLCAVQDLLNRPTVPSQAFPWDLLLQGHREAETPYFGSKQTFKEKVTPWGEGRTLCNPIADWTEAEVWGYIKRYHLPVDKRRYYAKDASVSPDSYNVCHRCINANHYGQTVFCPKLQESIPSVARPPREHREKLDSLKAKVRHVQYDGEPLSTVSQHL